MSFNLVDLVGVTENTIQAKIHRSKVFAKVLGYVYIKFCKQKVPSIRSYEAAKELQMDVNHVNRNLNMMVTLGILRKVIRTHKIVLYVPERNDGNPVCSHFVQDIEDSLGLRR